MEKKRLNEIFIDRSNLYLLENKNFCALTFSTEGAQGASGKIQAVDIKGNKYIMTYMHYKNNYIPLERIVMYYFPFLKNWDIVMMDQFDLFIASSQGRLDFHRPRRHSLWHCIDMGCGNFLFIHPMISDFVDKNVEALVPPQIYQCWETIVISALENMNNEKFYRKICDKVSNIYQRIFLRP